MPCSCGKVYIGTTKRSVSTRLVKHKRCCRLHQLEKSAVAEHGMQPGHGILFKETVLMDDTTSFFQRLHREVIEIYKHRQYSINRKEESLIV